MFTSIRDAETALGFRLSNEPIVGALLRVLVASRPGGRVLELGTGLGMSTACLLDGLDASGALVTVDNEAACHDVARRILGSDPRVTFVLDDATAVLERFAEEHFDVIFADAWPGKFQALDRCLRLLKRGGMYVVDDLTPVETWPPGRAEKVRELVESLESRVDYKTVHLSWASGILVAVRVA
jgi:predicted O-methyltransferase YrrM